VEVVKDEVQLVGDARRVVKGVIVAIWIWCYKHTEKEPQKLSKTEWDSMESVMRSLGPSKDDNVLMIINCDGKFSEEDLQEVVKARGGDWAEHKLRVIKAETVEELFKKGGDDGSG
jgi:hypothetical protein